MCVDSIHKRDETQAWEGRVRQLRCLTEELVVGSTDKPLAIKAELTGAKGNAILRNDGLGLLSNSCLNMGIASMRRIKAPVLAERSTDLPDKTNKEGVVDLTHMKRVVKDQTGILAELKNLAGPRQVPQIVSFSPVVCGCSEG